MPQDQGLNDYINPVVYQHGLEGDGYLSPCGKYFWVKMHKCASTYIEALLISLNWQVSNYRARDDKESLIYFTVLRDPIERWVSGITEYLRLQRKQVSDLNEFTVKMIFDAMIFDVHTQHQAYFLEDINLKNIVFFKFDSDLTKNLEHWFNSQNLSFNQNVRYRYDDKPSNLLHPVGEFFKELTNGKYKKHVLEWFNYELRVLPKLNFYRC